MKFGITASGRLTFSHATGYVISSTEADRYDGWIANLAFATVCYTTHPTDKNKNLIRAILDSGPCTSGAMNLAIVADSDFDSDNTVTLTIAGTRAEFESQDVVAFYYVKLDNVTRLCYVRVSLRQFLTDTSDTIEHCTVIDADRFIVDILLEKGNPPKLVVPTAIGNRWEVTVTNMETP